MQIELITATPEEFASLLLGLEADVMYDFTVKKQAPPNGLHKKNTPLTKQTKDKIKELGETGLYTRRQIAEMLNVSFNTVHRYIERGSKTVIRYNRGSK